MIEGLVSVIIPVFNRPAMLREAVHSAFDQTYPSIEIIIVDDGSTDETHDACDELATKHPDEVRAIHQPNSGPGLAREAGRQAARGEFIQYLDSDDLLLPEKLARQVEALRTNPECGVVYCWTRYVHADGRTEPAPWKGSGTARETMFPSFLRERWWDTPTPLYRRSVTDAAGPWTNLRLEEDWEYDCRIAALGTKLARVPEFLVEVRDHVDGRLCRSCANDSERFRQRVRAHRMIYEHARRAGIGVDTPEMKRFARELFLLSRQSGAAGLADESRLLFDLAREASGVERGRGLDFLCYRTVASLIGWHGAGRLASLAERLRLHGKECET